MYDNVTSAMRSFLDNPWYGSRKEMKILGTFELQLGQEYITINRVRESCFLERHKFTSTIKHRHFISTGEKILKNFEFVHLKYFINQRFNIYWFILYYILSKQ